MLRQLNERMQKWGFSWEGLRDNRHGEWWVLAQMLLIAAHWLPPTPPPSDLGIDWPLLGPTAAAAIPLYQSPLLALATVLSLKARREERCLCSRHSSYADYMTSTPAIVPLLPGLDWR